MLNQLLQLSFRESNCESILAVLFSRISKGILVSRNSSTTNSHLDRIFIKGQTLAQCIMHCKGILIKAGHVGHFSSQTERDLITNIGGSAISGGAILIYDFLLKLRCLSLNSYIRITNNLNQKLGCNFTGIDRTGIFHKVITSSKVIDFDSCICCHCSSCTR